MKITTKPALDLAPLLLRDIPVGHVVRFRNNTVGLVVYAGPLPDSHYIDKNRALLIIGDWVPFIGSSSAKRATEGTGDYAIVADLGKAIELVVSS